MTKLQRIAAIMVAEIAWAEAHLDVEALTPEQQADAERMARKAEAGASAINLGPAPFPLPSRRRKSSPR